MIISELQKALEDIKGRLGDLPVYGFLNDEEVTEVESINEQALGTEIREQAVAVRLS